MAVVRGGFRSSGHVWGTGALRVGSLGLVGTCFVVASVGAPAAAHAEPGMCHVVDVDFLPAEIAGNAPMRAASQIVAWVESPTGDYVDTIFITQQTGSFGLGNRPGRFDFNSGPRWPYGRRVTVFPVWSHRRVASGLPSFPEVVFQNEDEDNLSHPFNESSRELNFCRPLMQAESGWDTGTCASAVFTDKGVLGTRTSVYPPRNDVVRGTPDHPSVEMYQLLNPFDAVSQATPPSGVPAELSWPIPDGLPTGDYVMWVEVSREFDRNATYAYPEPSGIPWSEYGEPYRGQPSIVYKVPFNIGTTESVASVLDYLGYGDPDGVDGNIRPPDGTITTGVTGSGAERFSIRVDGDTSYRVRVTARPEFDYIKPAAPTGAEVNTLSSTAATVQFTAPGDDELVGKVKGYEIRYVVGPTLTEEAYPLAQELKPDITISEPGTIQEFEMTGLLYDTEYTVGIRALDDCRNTGPLTFVTFRTPDRATGEVDACFVATAAYGSVMANDVEMLRRFRDMLLQNTVLGELAVEAYYTFGPAVAGVVGESELLRATTRAALDPLVHVVKVLRF
ncbi:MAG: fibronectin type III domain-containing protein [Deltaproteobacteria bacterium]|nr:fibronectin type III domain-containing protein [Deltaproteobacteria bacterium]MDQ3297118.1 fibronectin type III domain-containing protein [Myxococcota bacterium]